MARKTKLSRRKAMPMQKVCSGCLLCLGRRNSNFSLASRSSRIARLWVP